MSLSKRVTKSFLYSTLALASLASMQALAQTAPAAAAAQASSDTATIVVTARRVDERIIDVPLTIKALGAKDLQDRGITSISELSLFTPGLSYSPDFGRVGERPVVRGISALRTEAPQPVSVFVDGIFVRDGTLGLILDDAQRIEVIKGPQSALYGRSTYAGAINYVTVKPGDKLAGTVTLGSATKAETQAFAAVSAPLVKDLLSLRVKAKRYEYGGEYTNQLSGNKVGNERTNAAGLLFNLTPNKDLGVLLSLDTSSDKDGLFAATVRTIPTQVAGVVTNQNGSSNAANGSVCNNRTINIVGNNAVTGLPDASVPAAVTTRVNGWPCGAATFTGTTVRRNEADLASYTDPATGISYGDVGGLDRHITRGGLTVSWEFGGGYEFVSQTGVTKQKANTGTDQSYNGTRFAITGASWLTYDRDQLDYKSQEFRLSSPQNQPLTWLLGAFYYDEDTKGLTTGVIIRNSAGAVVNEALRNKSASSTTNAAPFGRVQYEINPAMRVSVEGRYNRETVKVGGTPLGTAIVTVGTCTAGQVCFLNGEKTFTDFSPRFTLDFKPGKDSLLYAQVAKGSKSGGFNTTPGLPAANFTYDGETVKSVEAGFKTVLAGGSMSMSAAIFRNDIDGLQLSNISTVTNPFNGTATTTTIVNNVGKARTQGIEVEGSVRATDWLTFSGNYAYTDAKALKGSEITNGTVFGGNTSVEGFQLPRSPKNSYTASAAIDAPTAEGAYRLFGRVDVIYQSRRYAEIQNLIWADAFHRVNFSAGIKTKTWRVSAWLKNAANDDTSLNGFRYVDPTTFRRSAVDFLPRLRQFGLTGTLDF
jgi:iron complex outermembrane recepter protein